MQLKPLSKISILLIRLIGFTTALVLFTFGSSYILMKPGAGVGARTYGVITGIIYICLCICLVLPYGLIIRKQKFSFWFVRTFFWLGIIFTLSSFFFKPVYVGLIIAIGVFANIWLVYQRFEKLLASGDSPD